ncbi:MAG TPA: GtrA family protein [Chthonomonadaceae bacterium]|nr:GtrA family protein [Chthonomonadaceae bacterium]
MIQIASEGGLQRMVRHPSLRQFIKFCMIGCTSMVIDVGIAKYLTYSMHWNWILAQTLSFSIAVTNGFVWNSLWTFRGMGSGSRHQQYMKFVAINIVGLVLNIAIMKSVFFMFTGHIIHQGNPPSWQWNIAKGLAIVIVSSWNFLANKKWTFSG